jgi:hypothetical protein
MPLLTKRLNNEPVEIAGVGPADLANHACMGIAFAPAKKLIPSLLLSQSVESVECHKSSVLGIKTARQYSVDEVVTCRLR